MGRQGQGEKCSRLGCIGIVFHSIICRGPFLVVLGCYVVEELLYLFVSMSLLVWCRLLVVVDLLQIFGVSRFYMLVFVVRFVVLLFVGVGLNLA